MNERSPDTADQVAHTPVVQALARPAMQGGVPSGLYLYSLLGAVGALLVSGFTVVGLVVAGVAFVAILGVFKIGAMWDPHFLPVLIRSTLQQEFYPASSSPSAPGRQVRRRTSFLK